MPGIFSGMDVSEAGMDVSVCIMPGIFSLYEESLLTLKVGSAAVASNRPILNVVDYVARARLATS
jgi:hypothetical protein